MSTAPRRSRLVRSVLVPLLLALAPLGCERGPAEGEAREGAMEAPAPSNRVDINASVRRNLGITFTRVESRDVARTLRVPGRFEALPMAGREYRAAAAGTVELLVEQYQRVEAGQPLYRLDSPRWREVQRELVDAEAAVKLAAAANESIGPLLEAHENHHAEIQKSVDLWTARVEALEPLRAAGGARAEEVAQAAAALAAARSDLAETLETEAELRARGTQAAAQLEAAVARLAYLYDAAATMAGVGAAGLRAPSAIDPASPLWRTLSAIEVRASAPGVVETVGATSGGFVDQHGRVLSTVQPERVRFRAVGLQSDLPRLANGQRASVVAARLSGGAVAGDGASALTGTLALAPTADPERRTVDLVLTPAEGSAPPPWARAGVSAFLEVVTAGSGGGGGGLAIPLRCVARDGTAAVIFRRDPADPNKAIRMEADLGMDDGRWVVIESGVAEGDEIVLDGVYQLMVATSTGGGITKGGHFHPDGTFHEGED